MNTETQKKIYKIFRIFLLVLAIGSVFCSLIFIHFSKQSLEDFKIAGQFFVFGIGVISLSIKLFSRGLFAEVAECYKYIGPDHPYDIWDKITYPFRWFLNKTILVVFYLINMIMFPLTLFAIFSPLYHLISISLYIILVFIGTIIMYTLVRRGDALELRTM